MHTRLIDLSIYASTSHTLFHRTLRAGVLSITELNAVDTTRKFRRHLPPTARLPRPPTTPSNSSDSRYPCLQSPSLPPHTTLSATTPLTAIKWTPVILDSVERGGRDQRYPYTRKETHQLTFRAGHSDVQPSVLAKEAYFPRGI